MIRKMPKGPEALDEAEDRLVEHGVDPAKAARAKQLLKHVVKEGGPAAFDPTAMRRNPVFDRKRR